MIFGRAASIILMAAIAASLTSCSRFSYRKVGPSTFEIHNRSGTMIEMVIVKGYSYIPLTSEPQLIRNQALYRRGMADRYPDQKWIRIDLAPGKICTIKPVGFLFVPESLSDPGPDADLGGIEPVGLPFQTWEPQKVTRPVPMARDEWLPIPAPIDWESLLLFDFTMPFVGTDEHEVE